MSARSGTIDSLQFARAGRNVSGEFSAADAARLGDILNPSDGAVQYLIEGRLGGGRPVLNLKVQTTVRLTCQRCLETFALPLSIESELWLARDEAELARWEAEDALVDAVLADERLDVRELVEDEILLSLPVAPRHPEGECIAPERA